MGRKGVRHIIQVTIFYMRIFLDERVELGGFDYG